MQVPVGSDGRIDAFIPPGTYAVEVPAPAGYYASVGIWPFDGGAELVIPHVRACPSLFVHVSYDGHLKGRVVDASGRGVPGVNVEATRPVNTRHGTPLASTMTDAAGGYDLAHLSPGAYRVAVNVGWNGVLSRVQKPRVYHPGTTNDSLPTSRWARANG
jgi:hypothetical protein